MNLNAGSSCVSFPVLTGNTVLFADRHPERGGEQKVLIEKLNLTSVRGVDLGGTESNSKGWCFS